MKRKGPGIWIWLVVIGLLVAGAALRVIFPLHGGLEKELPEGSYTASELFREFTSDPVGAYQLLASRVIILEDTVATFGDGFAVMGKDLCRVRCQFRRSVYDRKPEVETGDRITIKGICRGQYMTEILVTHCIIINK
jgi:hypothetical protein